MDDLIVIDSATQLDASARGQVVVCGSHGGLYAAWLAASAGVRAIVLNDAGIGRHSAGIAGVMWLGGLGIAACALHYRSPRIPHPPHTPHSAKTSMLNHATASHTA